MLGSCAPTLFCLLHVSSVPRTLALSALQGQSSSPSQPHQAVTMEAASSSPPPDEVLRVGSSRQKRTFELMEDRASAASDDEREGEQSADEDDGYRAARNNGSGRRRESRQDDEDSEMTDLDDQRDPPSRRLSTLSTASKGKAKAEDSDEEADASIPAGGDTVECLWESCGKHFSTLQSLIQHLHSGHIGFHKARYTCEWVGCPRKGKTQTSRFALLSHLRSHTGEKPFTCPLPECDKSFTRSDALSKHMRLQHGLVQSAARRGKQLRKPRVSNSKGGDEEGEEEEGIALSDFESVEKPPVRPDTTFTDAELGIVRAPYEDDEEEAFILTMREKGAEVLKQYWDLGTGSLAPVESASDTEEEEAEDKAEHSHNTRRNAKRFKPSALDLINNNAASAASRAQPKKEPAEAAPENRYKKLYLIEQAKLKFLRAENEELRREFEELQREEAKVRAQKTDILEQVLTLELGQDVDAIFSPKGTPPPMPTYTEQRGPPPAV